MESVIPSDPGTTFHSLDCLVVGDDPTIRLCLEHMIRDGKHRASSTADGASALTLILGRSRPRAQRRGDPRSQ